MNLFNKPNNWTEDFQYENGNYMCHCIQCGEFFIGYKRRTVCRVCDTTPHVPQPAVEAPTVEPKLYTYEEVRELLHQQKEYTIQTLGISSHGWFYPADYEKMKEWMMRAKLVI